MTENRPEEEPRRGSTAPGMEGEGGQYAVDTPAESLEAGQYPDGDYGDAGTTGSASPEDAGRERLTEGQVNTTAEERSPLHGDPDAER